MGRKDFLRLCGESIDLATAPLEEIELELFERWPELHADVDPYGYQKDEKVLKLRTALVERSHPRKKAGYLVKRAKQYLSLDRLDDAFSDIKRLKQECKTPPGLTDYYKAEVLTKKEEYDLALDCLDLSIELSEGTQYKPYELRAVVRTIKGSFLIEDGQEVVRGSLIIEAAVQDLKQASRLYAQKDASSAYDTIKTRYLRRIQKLRGK